MTLAQLNDALRKKLCTQYQRNNNGYEIGICHYENKMVRPILVATSSVDDLLDYHFNTLLQLVADFDNFEEDNDPYGEHDFGMVEYEGTKYFFKWDYYDKALQCFGHDKHVLTIMESNEY